MQYEIKQGANLFYIGDSETEPDAYLRWSEQAGRILTAESTFTAPALRGTGVASLLFEAFMDYVRREGYKVVPACTYVAAKMDRKPELYSDLKA